MVEDEVDAGGVPIIALLVKPPSLTLS